MDDLSQLHTCLNAAATDKATERKKQIETLRRLVKTPLIQRALDSNKGRQDRLQWDTVVQLTSHVVNHELEGLQKAKVGESAIAKANHAKKAAAIGNLYRYVVEQADARGPQLSIRRLLRHIINKLEDNYACGILGGEYLDILVKHVFSVQQYLSQISQELYQQLLDISIKLHDGKAKLKRRLVSEVIRCTVLHSSRYTDINLTQLVQFFSKAFHNCVESWPVLLNLVKAMNSVCSSRILECRIQLCGLGESIHVDLIKLWSLGPQLKDALVEFWTYQMTLHHPHGARNTEQGAYAKDWALWKGHLGKLYYLIYKDIQQISGRSKFGDHQNLVQSQQYIDLAADVFNQLFTEGANVLEITQILDTDPGTSRSSGGPKSKRQRLESGWEVLRDLVNPSSATMNVLPWIQIVTSLCKRHSADIPGDEICRLVEVALHQLQKPKFVDVTMWYLRCVDTMLQKWTDIEPNISEFTSSNFPFLWERIAEATRRLIGLHHAQSHAYQLLTSLEIRRFVAVNSAWWKVFCGQITDSGLEHLMSLLKSHEIPQSLTQSVSNQSYPFRNELFDWLMPDLSQRVDENEVLIGDWDVNALLMARILISLTFRDPTAMKFKREHVTQEQELTAESFLLECSFDRKPNPQVKNFSDEQSHVTPRHIVVLLKKLETVLMRDCRFLMELQEYNHSILKRLIYQCRLIVNCTALLMHYDVIMPSANQNSPWFDMLTSLLKKIEKHMVPMLNKNDLAVRELLRDWSDIYDLSRDLNHVTRNIMTSLLVNSTPQSLLNKVVQLSQATEVKRTNQNPFDGNASVMTSRSHMDMSMDLDLMMDVTDAGPVEQERDFPTMNEPEVMSSGDLDLFSPSALTDDQKIQISAVKALCKFVRLAEAPKADGTVSDARFESDWLTKVHKIKTDVLDLIEDQQLDVLSAGGLQLIQCVMEELLDQNLNSLSDDDIHCMLDVIKLLFKHHRKDGQICHVAVDIVTKLIPHLSDLSRCHDNQQLPGSHGDHNDPNESREQAREVLMHILTILWKLQLPQEGTQNLSFAANTRQAILKCIYTLVQYDPDQTWTLWSERAIDDKTRNLGKTAEDGLLLGLTDPSHQVRIYTAQNLVKWLFLRERNGKMTPRDKDQQNDAFKRLYQALKSVLTVEGALSGLSQADEAVNRAGCVLRILTTTITSSAICTKKATFIFFLLVKEFKIDQSLVTKVMEKVADELGFSDLSDYVNEHAAYVIDKWLNLGYPVWDFPCRLFGCTDRDDLYRQFHKTMVPLLINHDQLDAINVMADILQRPLEDLLRSCLPNILTHMLPYLAQASVTAESASMSTRVSGAQHRYDWLEKTIGATTVDDALIMNLEEIVVNILVSLQIVPSDGADAIPVPEANPPCFSSAMIKTCLEYLTARLKSRSQSVVGLLSKNQDGVPKVLMALKKRLYKCSSQRIYGWYHSLYIYSFFVQTVTEDLRTLDDVWPYVVRDVLYTVVHSVNRLMHVNLDIYTHVVKACFDKVIGLLNHVIAADQSGVGISLISEFLPIITNILVTVINEKADDKCVRLLEDLMRNPSPALQSAIGLLDPLPWSPDDTLPWQQEITLPYRKRLTQLAKIQNEMKYKHREWTLEEEIRHFVRTGEECCGQSTRIEGLRFLCQQLQERKAELVTLQQKCSQKTPSDAILPRLVSVLLSIVKNVKGSTNAAEVACRCLGEIGPVNLCVNALSSTTVSTVHQKHIQFYLDRKQAAMAQKCEIMNALDRCLISDNIETVMAAFDVIRTLRSRTEAQKFFSQFTSDMTQQDWPNTMVRYLKPFFGCKKKVPNTHAQTYDLARISDDSLWLPMNVKFDVWVRKLVTNLIEASVVQDPILNLLAPVCAVHAEFSALLLPYIIHDILARADDVLTELLSRYIRQFFTQHCGAVERESSRVTTPSIERSEDDKLHDDHRSVDCFLNVVEYLRRQPRLNERGGARPTVWENNFWLDLDYLELATAAQTCGRHFTAVVYAEIWCDVQKNLTENEHESVTSSQSSQSQLSTLPDERRASVMSLLLESYKAIGDPDAVYGCDVTRLADPFVRIKTYEHEQRWGKALCAHDLEMCTPDHSEPKMSTQLGVIKSLSKFGTLHVLDTYMQGLCGKGLTDDPEIQTVQYEAALKCGKWDLNIPSNDSVPDYHKSTYCAVSALREKDKQLFEKHVKLARISCVEKLESCDLISAQTTYKLMAQMLSLCQIEDSCRILMLGTDPVLVRNKWNDQLKALADTDYQYTDTVLDNRVMLMNLMHGLRPNEALRDGLISEIQNQARLTTQAGLYQTAARAIRDLKHLICVDVKAEDTNRVIYYDTIIDEAQLYWCRSEKKTAMAMMTSSIKRAKQCMAVDLGVRKKFAQMLGLYGDWLAETHGESPQTIMEDYLEKSVKLLERFTDDDDSTCIQAYSALARYADTQYRLIKDYSKSSVYESKVALTHRAREEVEKLNDLKSKGGDVGRYVKLLEKQTRLDEREMETMANDQQKYLLRAVQTYIRLLQLSGQHDLRIFRLVSLWFDNSELTQVSELIKTAISDVSSHKFLPMMYQLAARMSVDFPGPQKMFQKNLTDLMYKCCHQHPYHSLPVILALAHGNLDAEFLNNPASSTKRQQAKAKAIDEGKEDRAIAAVNLMTELRKSAKVEIITEMETLSRAYIQFANMPADKFKSTSKSIPIPSTQTLSKLKNMKSVPVPTDTVPVDPTCSYENIETIHMFEQTFSLAGGINLPKIICCIGTDGRRRKQLVKGKDDLRQDAVMQQVFGMVNTLLNKDKETRKRELSIRTYKIIPLSQRSGILQWCEGTLPLGEYLIGRAPQGAHARYRPDDWAPAACRDKIKAVAGLTSEEKLYVYQDICRNFKPVLRHFFLENFPQPPEWYEKRMAYTRSVATNSIVGYILGLGDRHVQNILIDTESAELVHIDLGVAFEQGKLLPTPETVPFRLTRDIVDGMGVTGVEGVFRRCCERTMLVMRNSEEVLLTILEVLLYDPLYSWSMSPLKAYLVQHRREKQDGEQLNTTHLLNDSLTTQDVNKTAERVLLRLKQKLQGIEQGVNMNIGGQVNMLIQEAMDPNNLCRLFCGWQPYL